MYGKILVLKNLAMSKLVYNISVLCVPNDIVKEVIKCFHGFLWKNTDRIKRNTLIADYSKGGLKMIDVEIMIESIKAAWIPRILRTSPDQNVLNEYLSKTGISLHTVLNCPLSGTVRGISMTTILTWLLHFFALLGLYIHTGTEIMPHHNVTPNTL